MICVKNKGLRTFLSLAAAAAVVYFGSTGPDDAPGVTNAVLALALVAGLLVWFLTKPGTDKPVS